MEEQVWTKAYLDNSEPALVGCRVSGNGEASGGVSRNDAVDCAPGLSVGLVFVRHRQVGDNHIHSVLVYFSKELE